MYFFYAVLIVIAAYLLGSINFAVIFTKKYNNVDIRDFGSGNAGTTNVLRVAGKRAGLITFAFDILKGAVATALGLILFKYLPYNYEYGMFLCGLACMLGHCFPVFFGFRGGKAVATSVGIFAVCCPLAIILGLLAFAVGVIISKIVSLSSLIATFVVVGVTCAMAYTGNYSSEANPTVLAVITALCGLLVILRHIENIKRILNGTEKKFSIKKEKR